MLETDQKQNQNDEPLGDDVFSARTTGLGFLLRSEREKRGFTQKQISEIIRIRQHTIDDLENERWNELPQPVFVKGFLRSYARTLEIDEKKVLDLYRDVASESAPPKPLVEPKGNRKKIVSLILILFLIGVFVFYFRAGQFSDDRKSDIEDRLDSVKKEGLEKSLQTQPAPVEDPRVSEGREGLTGGTPIRYDKMEEVHQGAEKRVESPKNVPLLQPVIEERGPQPAASSPMQNPNRVEGRPAAETEGAGVSPGDHAQGGQTERTDASRIAATETAGEGADLPGKVLTAEVKLKTWVRVCVDGRQPKEYIFQPGSTPEWRATEGFAVIVGNAAGMAFDFDGKKIDQLGKIGQVVRLRFPEDYKAKPCGE